MPFKVVVTFRFVRAAVEWTWKTGCVDATVPLLVMSIAGLTCRESYAADREVTVERLWSSTFARASG